MNFNELYTGNLKWLPNSVLFLTVHGSRCYRTHTPTSDYDYKGFCVPPKKYFHGFMNRFEQAEQNEPDLVVYDIRKFFQLASMANPNILEVLFTDPSDHVVLTKLGQKVLDHKYEFLSSRVKHSFSGYAVSQLRRMKGHYRRFNTPAPSKPSREEYGLPTDTKLSSSVMGAFHKLQNEGYEFGMDIMEVMEREKKYAQALKEYRQYEHWKKNRNPKRAADEEKHGVDLKNAYHMVRLLKMCEEMLTTGEVHVKRPDASQLLEIRNGAWSYEYLISWAESKDLELQELYKKTSLPKNPNTKKLDELCCEVVEEFHSQP